MEIVADGNPVSEEDTFDSSGVGDGARLEMMVDIASNFKAESEAPLNVGEL